MYKGLKKGYTLQEYTKRILIEDGTKCVHCLHNIDNYYVSSNNKDKIAVEYHNLICLKCKHGKFYKSETASWMQDEFQTLYDWDRGEENA